MITTESGFDYTWNAELVATPAEDTAADTGNNGNNGDSTPNVDNGQFDDKETNIEAVGCGCASTQALPMSLWMLGLAGLLIRRR
jgi:MYXO-CTERM domain-containing protein